MFYKQRGVFNHHKKDFVYIQSAIIKDAKLLDGFTTKKKLLELDTNITETKLNRLDIEHVQLINHECVLYYTNLAGLSLIREEFDVYLYSGNKECIEEVYKFNNKIKLIKQLEENWYLLKDFHSLAD